MAPSAPRSSPVFPGASSALVLAAVAAAEPPLLPSDTILHPSWSEQGVSVRARHEFDRTILRPGIAWQDSIGPAVLELLDTASVVRDPTPSRLDGVHGFHAALSRPVLSGSGTLSLEQLAQFEGQLADSAGLAGSHARGRVLAGWNRPWGGFRLGGWSGLLWERDDPAAGGISLNPGEEARRGAYATALGGIEAGWDLSVDDAERQVAAHVQRDQGAPELREESSDLRALWTTRSLPWGRLAAQGEAASARRRSDYLGQDRSLTRREIALSWTLEAFSQELVVGPRAADTTMRDYTGRVPGEDSRGWGWSADLGGALPSGFEHRHVLGWDRADRDVMDIDGNRGVTERKQSSENRLLRLADTLGWSTPRLGRLSVRGGWTRSLQTSRYPENPDPGLSDRPEQDLSETGVGVAIRDSALARREEPLLAWSWIGRDEVYLRAVRSAETRHVEGHRLSGDVAVSPARRVLVELGSKAREQRTTYRFDSTRDAGLMELQWDAALQEGPAQRPEARFWIEQRWTWTGALVGEDFAVENRTVVWKPGARTWWRPFRSWSLSPWVEYWLQTSRTWDGSRLASDPRQSEWRLAIDLDAEFAARGSATATVQRILADPGTDDWRFTGEGRWAW